MVLLRKSIPQKTNLQPAAELNVKKRINMVHTYRPSFIRMFLTILFPGAILFAIAVLYKAASVYNESTSEVSAYLLLVFMFLPSLAYKLLLIASVASIFFYFAFSIKVSESGITYRKFLIKEKHIPWKEISEYKKSWLLVPLVTVKSNRNNENIQFTAKALTNTHFSTISKNS